MSDDNEKHSRADYAVGDDPFADFDLSWLEADTEAIPEPLPEPAPEPASMPESSALPPTSPPFAPQPEAPPLTASSNQELFAWLTPGLPPDRAASPPATKPPPTRVQESEALAWLLARECPAIDSVDSDEADAALEAWLNDEEGL